MSTAHPEQSLPVRPTKHWHAPLMHTPAAEQSEEHVRPGHKSFSIVAWSGHESSPRSTPTNFQGSFSEVPPGHRIRLPLSTASRGNAELFAIAQLAGASLRPKVPMPGGPGGSKQPWPD